MEVTDHHGKRITTTKTSWDAVPHKFYMSFENSPEGIHVLINW